MVAGSNPVAPTMKSVVNSTGFLFYRCCSNLREIGDSDVLNLREIGEIFVLNLREIGKYFIFASESMFYIMEKRVFKRKVYDKILQWKQESNGESALMIQGARRIGKSTIVEEFAKKRILVVFDYRFQ